MPDTPEMKAAREALVGFETLTLVPHGPQDDDSYLLCLADEADTDVARVWGTDPECARALSRLLARAPTDLRAALARVDALEASQHKARARDVAAIVGWVRKEATRRANTSEAAGNTGTAMTAAIQYAELWLAADAIERGEWHDGTLPPDPRDARIAELERDLAAYKRAKAENDERFMLERDEARNQLAAARRLLANDYVPWESAGGPNDCPHQRSTPCPECDRAVVGVARG